jgi:murein DD-endopeptidase MepM/ murein hydrolase activator NlpD
VDNKKITFFIATNESGKTKKFVLSASWIRIAVIFLIFGVFAILAGVMDYLGLLIQTAENKRLRAENAQLIKQFQVVEGKVTALESNLERVKTFTTKLKLITNIDGEDRSLKLAMNPQPSPGQSVTEYDQPLEQRGPLNELANQDEEFSENPPADEVKGELSVEMNRDYQSLAIRIDRSIKDAQLREQSVLDLWETLSEKQNLMNAIPNIRPARGWITSKFGYRISPFTGRPAMHAGLDFAAAPGSPVYAPADGVVSFAGYDEGYGKMVTIDHGYGYSTRYGHNAQIYVQVGQRVSRWDIIAAVGNTGRSTGPHLHYEVRLNGVPKNPINFILDE